MAGFPDAEEANVLDHYFGGSALAAPEATLKIDLLTTLPSDDAGTGLVKASYTGYTQLSVTNNVTNFPAASGTAPTIKSNGILFGFGQKTDAGTVTIVGFVVYENDGTTILFVGDVTPNAVVAQNATAEFPIGTLDFKLGDPGDTYT